MRLTHLHDELAAFGVSQEVHALVDDLCLDFGRPPFILRILYRKSLKEIYVKPRCRVYVSHHYIPPIQGRLF